MTKSRPSDLYIAFKALALARRLTRNEALVAGALLAHFNVKTSQCDPSIGRLEKMLAIARSKVLKATAALCNAADDGKYLFDKDSHGGKSHRASYTPKWDRFAKIVADWETSMAKPSPDGPQKADVNGPQKGDGYGPQKGDGYGPQKGDTNSLKELIEETLGAREAKATAVIERRKWLGSSSAKPPPEQRSIIYAIPGGKSEQPSRSDAAHEQAKRRISDQIRGTDIEAWLTTDDPKNIWFDAAVKREIFRRGWGLKWLRGRMMNQRMTRRLGTAAKP
ncbi:MAG: hypothetical protein EOS34_20915 [Mesorhizobium sp.]|nr:MAG: hypothetical protein EOS34_20915 [Mesorhizobium sp.]